MGKKVTATEKYGLSNAHVEQYTNIIGLCTQLISAKLEKKAALLLTNMVATDSPVIRVMTATDNTYRTQRA